jgi:hypothetical protein
MYVADCDSGTVSSVSEVAEGYAVERHVQEQSSTYSLTGSDQLMIKE